MANGLFAKKFHPLWALPLLATLVWHVAHTILVLDPQYLFFVCYSANLLLGLGLLRRSALLVGIGFGWLLLAFPLWLYDAVLTGNWEASCTLFHLVGLAVVREVVERGDPLGPEASWAPELEAWREETSPYLLYPRDVR